MISARPSNHFFRRAPFPPNVFVSNGASSAPVTLTKNVSRSMTCIQAVEEQRTSQIYWPTPKTAGSPASARGATEPRAVSLTPLPVLIIAISENGARPTPATPRRSPFCPFNRIRPRRFSSPERRSAGSLTARPPPRPVQHHHRLASTYTVAHVRPRSPALRTRRRQDGPPSHLSRSVGPGHSRRDIACVRGWWQLAVRRESVQRAYDGAGGTDKLAGPREGAPSETGGHRQVVCSVGSGLSG